MPFKIVIKKRIEHHIMNMIIILMFFSAVFNIMYWQTSMNELWGTLFSYTLYALFLAESLQIVLLFKGTIDKITIAVFIYCLYEVLSLVFLRNTGLGLLVRAGLVWPLMFLSSYLYTKKYGINENWRLLTLFFTAVCMILLIKNIQLHFSGVSFFGGVIGVVYYCISFLALILLINNRKLKLLYSVLIVALIVASAKRGGLISILIGLLAFYFIIAIIQEKQKDRLTKFALLLATVGILSLCIYWFVSNNSVTVVERIYNIFDDQGSGRVLIWTRVFNAVKNSDTLHIIFGHGFHSVPIDLVLSNTNRNILAHNSYLEALYDYGIIGVAVLIVLVVYMIRFTIGLVQRKRWYAPVMGYVIVITLSFSLVSYFFDESRFILPIALTCGIIWGLERNRIL